MHTQSHTHAHTVTHTHTHFLSLHIKQLLTCLVATTGFCFFLMSSSFSLSLSINAAGRHGRNKKTILWKRIAQRVSQYSLLVNVWILTSRQLHRVTSGWITHSNLFLHQFKTQVTKSHAKSRATALDTTVTTNKSKAVNNKRISILTFHLTTTNTSIMVSTKEPLHNLWCVDSAESTKINGSETSSGQTVTEILNLCCDLDLHNSNPIFSLDTSAHDNLPSDYVKLQKND